MQSEAIHGSSLTDYYGLWPLQQLLLESQSTSITFLPFVTKALSPIPGDSDIEILVFWVLIMHQLEIDLGIATWSITHIMSVSYQNM